jgi:hypothetical protein
LHHRQVLSAPFQCLEYVRLDLHPHTTRSPADCSNDTETLYGMMHALYLADELSTDCAVAQDCAVAHGCFVRGDSVPASRVGTIYTTAGIPPSALPIC